jgi:hypothetical protein
VLENENVTARIIPRDFIACEKIEDKHENEVYDQHSQPDP